MTSQEQLNKIHSLELMIAVEIKRICEKNNIKYFLTAGTLLGAVRHSGFIPWDDDMDIGMLREDYEKFIKACAHDLRKEYFLQTWDTDPEFPFSYGKLRLCGTHFIEGFSENSAAHNGIFVDIFPFDNVPDNQREKNIQGKIYFLCKRLLWIKKGMGSNMKKGSIMQKCKYYFFVGFAHLFSYDRIKKYYSEVQQKYNNQRTQLVVTDGSYSYNKESIKREWVENLQPVQFENELFLSYAKKEEYLKYFYGDYMKLPPVEKRNRHQLLNVDFGSY